LNNDFVHMDILLDELKHELIRTRFYAQESEKEEAKAGVPWWGRMKTAKLQSKVETLEDMIKRIERIQQVDVEVKS
jgi:hypothetical protein